MSVIIADIQRINDTASNVSGLLINKQLGVSNDSPRRIIYKDASGQFINITCDEDSSVNLDDVDHIQFNLAPSAIPNAEGLLRWNSTDGTLDLGMDGGDVTMQIGQELFIKVRNVSGSTILNGSPVYASGRTGNRPNIWLAQSNSDSTSQLIGVTTQDIASPDDGYVTSLGYVRGIKTDYTGIGNWGTTWNAGDKLYVSKTISGQLTNIAPTAPHHSDIVGTVEIVHSNLGSIYVNIQKHSTLEELTDVNGTPLTTSGQFPVWNQASGFFDFNENIANYTPRQVHIDTKEPTGFKERTSNNLYFYNDNYTFAISGSHDIYINGVKSTKSSASIQLPDTTNLYHIYYDANGTLSQSTTFPGFYLPYIASIYWNTTINSGLLGEERHGITMDADTHAWAHRNIGTRYTSGLTGTFSGTGFLITSGNLADEDIVLSIPEQTTCNILYKNGSADWEWIPNSTNYINFSGSDIRYNNGNVLANVPANQYVAYWIFGTNNINTPIISMIGQRVDTTLADARNNNTYESLSFGQLPFQEMKILYRVILRNDATPYEETLDLRSVSNLPAGTYVATSHSILTGLEWSQAGHNDTNFNVNINGSGNVGIGTTSPTVKLHVSGGGIFTDVVHGATPTVSSHLTTKEYVDSLVSGVTGNGTSGYIPKYISSSGLGNSIISQNASNNTITVSGTGIFNRFQVGSLLSSAKNDAVYLGSSGGAVISISSTSNAGSSGNELLGKINWYNRNNATNPTASIESLTDIKDPFNRQGSKLVFKTSTDGSGVERMCINHSGNVGIGTSSPTADLTLGTDTTFEIQNTGFIHNATYLLPQNTHVRFSGMGYGDVLGTQPYGGLQVTAINMPYESDGWVASDVMKFIGVQGGPDNSVDENRSTFNFLAAYSENSGALSSPIGSIFKVGLYTLTDPLLDIRNGYSISYQPLAFAGYSPSNFYIAPPGPNLSKINIYVDPTANILTVYKNVTDPCVSNPAEILRIYPAANDYGGNVINCTSYETEDFSPLTIKSNVQGTIPPGNALIDLIGTYNSGEILNNSPLFRVSNQYYNRFIVSAQGNVSIFNDSTIDGNMTVSASHYTYYGDSSTDSSWRIGTSGTNLTIQKRDFGVGSWGSNRVTINESGNISARGYTDTSGYIDYSSSTTINGWSTTWAKVVRFYKVGRLTYLYANIAGTSNSGIATFTLPFAWSLDPTYTCRSTVDTTTNLNTYFSNSGSTMYVGASGIPNVETWTSGVTKSFTVTAVGYV